MVNSSVDPARRMQKMIIVLVDAVCRPGGDLNDPRETIPLGGDLCEEGTFYTDHPEGSYLGETMIQELEAELASKYRVRPAADVVVSD